MTIPDSSGRWFTQTEIDWLQAELAHERQVTAAKVDWLEDYYLNAAFYLRKTGRVR